MILSKKYNKIMDRIEVTPELRQRILDNVQEVNTPQPKKWMSFPQVKRYISVTACFAVVFVAALLLPSFFELNQEQPKPNIDVEGTIYNCDSIEELEELVGFPMYEINVLPFKIENTTYTSYFSELGQISYTGNQGEKAIYRKSIGVGDNSGNYTDFVDVFEIKVNNQNVILKGNDNLYELAIWNDDVYSYSLSLLESVSETEWIKIITSLN